MRSLAIVALLVSVAHAEPAKQDDKTEPDPIAQEVANDANLESNAPRHGTTFSAAIGGSLLVGASGGTGKGGAVSLRVGHVATRHTLITFELTIGSFLHTPAMTATALHNDDVNFLVGWQWWKWPSFWLRGSAGIGGYSDQEPAKTTSHVGPSGLFGAGVELAKWRYLALDFEWFGVGKISRDGIHLFGGICLGLSYY